MTDSEHTTGDDPLGSRQQEWLDQAFVEGVALLDTAQAEADRMRAEAEEAAAAIRAEAHAVTTHAAAMRADAHRLRDEVEGEVADLRSEVLAEVDRLLTDPEAYRAMAVARNPFGDGHASERIVEALR